MNRASLLKERARDAPDPRAEALEVGAAFAEAAAANAREARRGADEAEEDARAADLEAEARAYLREGCGHDAWGLAEGERGGHVAPSSSRSNFFSLARASGGGLALPTT